VNATGWVVICELPQWVATVRPLSAVICEHNQALIGHYLVNPTLILYRCDTRNEALKYLKVVVSGFPDVVVAAPPSEPTSTSSHK